MSTGSRRRRLTIGAAIFVPTAAIAAVVFVPRDHARQVDLEEVVDRFRASTVPTPADQPIDQSIAPGGTDAPLAPATAEVTTTSGADAPTSLAPVPPPPALVEAGVYVYRTTGFETIDAFSGVTHDYPAETSITVVADGCGVLLRWDALAERREEWRLCSTPVGIELQPVALQYHEFFGQQTPETVTCDVPVLLVPTVDGQAGAFDPVAQTCTLDTDPWSPVWEVLETDTRTVDGATVDVRHVRMTIDDNDQYFEHYVADWYLAPSGLPVQLVVLKQSKSPSVAGDVVYDEQVLLDLVDLDPLR